MLPMRSTGGGVVTEAMLYAFDLLERDGEDVRSRPLAERKTRLAKLVGRSDRGIGGATVAARVQARTRGHRVEAALEAVSYRSGRSGHWLKVKNPESPAMARARQGTW